MASGFSKYLRKHWWPLWVTKLAHPKNKIKENILVTNFLTEKEQNFIIRPCLNWKFVKLGKWRYRNYYVYVLGDPRTDWFFKFVHEIWQFNAYLCNSSNLVLGLMIGHHYTLGTFFQLLRIVMVFKMRR